MRARAIFRDEWAGSDNLLLIMIDAYRGYRGALRFVTDPNGLIQEALRTGETAATHNENFETLWDSRGRRTPTGFEVEVVIPFKSLRFQPAAAGQEIVFSVGFNRNMRRKNRGSFCPFVSNDST